MQFAVAEVPDVDALMSDLLQVVNQSGPYNFIKLAHHGSYNGLNANVLKGWDQTLAFACSSGTNDSSHPDQDVLSLLKSGASDIEWARTDKNGLITVVFDGDKPTIETSRGKLNDATPPAGASRTRDSLAVPEGPRSLTFEPVLDRPDGISEFAGNLELQQGFAQLIRNPAYCGLIRTKQVEARGTFDALVTEELFQQVQDVLSGKRGARPTRHHKINAEFPLRGFLRCFKCGRPLTAGFPKGKYPTMWCWVTGCRGVSGRREKLESDFVNLLHTMQPTVELVANLPKLAAGLWQARTERIAVERKTQVQRLNDQSTLNSHAVAARVRGDISGEDFAGLKADITKTTAEIQEQIKAFDSETSTLESMMVEAKTSVLNLPKHWAAADTTQKQELQWALFPDGLMVSKEHGYFERGNTTLMESWAQFLNSLEGSTGTVSLENKYGRGERI